MEKGGGRGSHHDQNSRAAWSDHSHSNKVKPSQAKPQYKTSSKVYEVSAPPNQTANSQKAPPATSPSLQAVLQAVKSKEQAEETKRSQTKESQKETGKAQRDPQATSQSLQAVLQAVKSKEQAEETKRSQTKESQKVTRNQKHQASNRKKTHSANSQRSHTANSSNSQTPSTLQIPVATNQRIPAPRGQKNSRSQKNDNSHQSESSQRTSTATSQKSTESQKIESSQKTLASSTHKSESSYETPALSTHKSESSQKTPASSTRKHVNDQKRESSGSRTSGASSHQSVTDPKEESVNNKSSDTAHDQKAPSSDKSTGSKRSEVTKKQKTESANSSEREVSNSHILDGTKTKKTEAANSVKEQAKKQKTPTESQTAPAGGPQKLQLTTSPIKVSFRTEVLDRSAEVRIDLPNPHEEPKYKPIHSRGEGFQRHVVQLGFPSAPYRRIVHVTSRSLCLSCFATFILLLGSLILFGPVVAIVVILIPMCIVVKRICDFCCCCRFCGHCCAFCCNQHVSFSEQLWLHDSGCNTLAVQSLIILQHGLDTDRIRDLINARLISAEDRRGNRLYPRFTQKVVPFCCGYAWEHDRDFVINNHVFNMSVRILSLEDLQDYVSEMASRPMSMEHPLWEIQVYQNFGPQRDTVLLFRMHPCMTDGITMIRILEQALVDSQNLSNPSVHIGSGPAFLGTFRAFFLGPLTFCFKYLCLRADFNLLHGRHVHPSGDMAIAWSAPFSVRAATRIKQVSRCTMNELLMSMAAGNVRTYMQANGISNPFNMQCVIPVDFHAKATDSSNMGNKYTFVVLPLPTNIEGAIPRLWDMKMTMDKFKQSPEAAVVQGALWFTATMLPKSLYNKLWNRIYSKCTCLISNLAGPETNLRFASREIKCVMYWVPPLDRVTIAISFLTYGDQIRMSVISDRSVLPNPELITKDFIFQMETLSKLLAHRRIPGEQLSRRMESMHLLSSYTISDLTAEQIQLQMSMVQQELHDLKLQLEAESSRKISHNEAHIIKKTENLKEQFRELMVELRRKRATENENAIVLSEEEEESDSERPQRPFRRRTLSVSSKISTASVSSTIRPLSTAPPSGQPSPTHAGLMSWPELQVTDIEKALAAKKPNVYKQRLSTMDEYEMDETLYASSGKDDRRYHTY